LPAAGAAAGAAAGLLGAKTSAFGSSRAQNGFGVALGAGLAVATRRLWPVAPKAPAEVRPAWTPMAGEPTPDGEGLAVVVNASAGPALRQSPTDAVRDAFPRARVVEVGEELDLDVALKDVATDPKVRAIAIAGGDGSVGAAAAVALAAGKPLAVIPAGTLNHLARDLGVVSVDDAIEAIKDGDLAALDVAAIDGKTFLNTASFGAYSALVDARERLEDRIGKWPALLVALVQVLRRDQPIEVELDGDRRRIWMIFIGNCRYDPPGFAPSWRERLDDGVLDVRLVDASHPFARLRLLVAVLTGTLGRSRVYGARTVRSLQVTVADGPVRLARDGETFDGSRTFTVEKCAKPLPVYVLRNARPT
jgi:undecaprenyl-diphosphatase